VSALLLLAFAGSAHAQVDPCLPAEQDPILERAQLALVEQTNTATAALIAFGERIHPSVWPALWVRFPEPPPAVTRALLSRGVGTDTERAEAERLGLEAIHELLGDAAFTDRALALLDEHDNERAGQAAGWAVEQGHGEACRLAYVRGKAARKLRRYRFAAARLADAVRACHDAHPDYEARALLLSAQVARILGRPAELAQARSRLESLTQPVHSYWDDALFLEADLYDEKGTLDQARARYEAIVEAGGDQAPEAAWRLARMARADDDPERERTWLRRLATRPRLPSMERDRATYWLARSSTIASERQGLWTALVRRYGYHGRLALAALEDEAPERAAALRTELVDVVTATPAHVPTRRRPIFELAKDHAADGWPEAGAAILHGWACAERRGPEERLQAALLLAELDLPADAQLLVRPVQEKLLEAGLGPENLRAWRTIYSRPYQEALRPAAASEDIDPWLLTALAREESRFDPEVRSWAGAVGLTQLMPPTAAAAYATVLGGRLTDETRLKDPELNARLGAHVLAEGLRRYGSVPLALSAYNAGPGLTNGFLRRGPRELAAFVESISIAQTRGYVRRVTESWLRYRLLYGDERGRFPPLPDRTSMSR